jgi:hypothetical protein
VSSRSFSDADDRAVSARRVDAAVGEIFAAIDLRPDWQQHVGALATKRSGGEDVAALHARRRRVARACAAGGLDEAEYEQRLAELGAQRRRPVPSRCQSSRPSQRCAATSGGCGSARQRRSGSCSWSR